MPKPSCACSDGIAANGIEAVGRDGRQAERVVRDAALDLGRHQEQRPPDVAGVQRQHGDRGERVPAALQDASVGVGSRKASNPGAAGSVTVDTTRPARLARTVSMPT